MNFLKITFFSLITVSIQILPCTGIYLKTALGTYVHARTLEFGQDIKSQILFLDKNYNFKTPAPNNSQGMSWNSKYSVLGVNAYESDFFLDGVNEEGLSGGLFYFPGFAEYQEIKEEDYVKSIPMWALLTFILTNYESTEDIKNQLKDIYISKAELPGANEISPVHLIIHDKHGKSIVIECTKGILQIFDNPLGVLTNSPNFEWHIQNLRNYINLTPYNSTPKYLSGTELKQFGQSSGMIGLPGDFTPPSRFVRAVELSQNIDTPKDELEAVYSAFHILNNFDIPQGIIKSEEGPSDFTRWTSAVDTKNKVLYIRPYSNMQLQKISLDDIKNKGLEKVNLEIREKDDIFDLKNLI